MYNNFNAPYVPNLGNGQGWGGGFIQPQPQPVQQRGNKIYVVDAKDALSRAAMPDSLMVYIQQDETAMHEVYMDAEGRKLIIRVDGHLTCSMYGVVTDIWDCSEEMVDRYWVV